MNLPPVSDVVYAQVNKHDPALPKCGRGHPISEAWLQDFFTTKFPFTQMYNDRERMVNSFTGFAETLVPTLARLAVLRPDVVSRDFDLRKEGDLLKVVDAHMESEDIAWLEAQLNEVPELRSWATMFNDAVVDTYGDREHEWHYTELGAGLVGRCGVPGLEKTIDRDVKFMSLIRAVRDTDLDAEPFRMHMEKYKANRYGYAAIKVRDMVMPAETYEPKPGGGVAVSKASAEPSLLARA